MGRRDSSFRREELATYESEVAESARKLSGYLEQVGILRLSGEQEGDDGCPLVKFVSDVEATFADNRVADLLDAVRDNSKFIPLIRGLGKIANY